MPDVAVETKTTLDLLDTNPPALSTTSDMPKIETQPDSIAPAPVEPEEASEAETAQNSETEQNPEQETAANDKDGPKKPSKGVQKRLDELVKQREEERRRADSLQEMLAKALEGAQKRPEAPKQPEAEAEPVAPSRANYGDDDSWQAALIAYAEQKAMFAARREVAQTIQAERENVRQQELVKQQKAVQEAYKARVEKVSTELPDYQSVAERSDVQVSIPMAHAILMSEEGPRLQYYFGQNPEEAKRISALNPVQQLVEIGKLEVKLSKPAEQKVSVSAAPKPPTPHTPKSEVVRKSPQDESMEEYAARRQKELAAERRPGVRH